MPVARSRFPVVACLILMLAATARSAAAQDAVQAERPSTAIRATGAGAIGTARRLA
jgi:opacity protein-like surface antigen